MTDIKRSPLGCTTEQPSPTQFNTWCSKNKVLWPKCSTAMSASTGRCVVAKQRIKAGEVVVEVPDDAVLMAENCQIQQQLAEDGLLKPAEDALLEVQGLILGVMYESSLGVASCWAPYLSFLPADMTHMTLHWTESELAQLVGTAAHDKLMGRVQHPADAPTRVSQLFDELVLPFVQGHEGVCTQLMGGKGPGEVTQEEARDKLWPLYQWATCVVASYSFVLGDASYQGMVPVWDLLNHVTGAANVRLHHDAKREVLQMIATQDIPAGGEVVNCYGQLSNAELLRGYGYVEAHNSIKHVQLPAQFLIRAAAGAFRSQAGAAAADGAGDGAGGAKKKQQQGGAKEKPVTTSAAAASDSEAEEEGEQSSEEESEQSGSADAGQPSDDNADSSEEQGSDEEEHSDEDDSEEDEEPDWDLEDDEEEVQAAQQQPAPSLAAAQQQHIPDWEERWQLAFSLKLLPKTSVFQVPAGGLAALPAQLLPVLLLLLAEAGECEQLAEKAAAAMGEAADAAAAAAAGRGGKGSKGKKQKKEKSEAAAAEEPLSADAAAALVMEGLQFCSPRLLLSSLQLLLQLMQSRYSCSLQEDQVLLGQLDQLTPRLAAAVLARSAEKEVLEELLQTLAQPSAEELLMQQARAAMAAALKQLLAGAAAAAAGGGAVGCCGVPACSHKHQHHHHGHKHEQEQRQGIDSKRQKKGQQQQQEKEAAQETGGKQKKKRQASSSKAGVDNAAAAEGGSRRSKKPKQPQQQDDGGAAKGEKQAAGSKAKQAAAPSCADASFAFNFQV